MKNGKSDEAELTENGKCHDEAESTENGKCDDEAELTENGKCADEAGLTENGKCHDEAELTENGKCADEAGLTEIGKCDDEAESTENRKYDDEAGLTENGKYAEFTENVNIAHVREAAIRIKKWIHKTPVLTSQSLDEMAGRQIYLKAEHLQKTGSFKARGACNAVFYERQNNVNLEGVVTHSSGNHGQALAYAAQCSGIKCCVVVPQGTPTVKCQAINNYGANLVFCKPTPHSRYETCERISMETGWTIVPSSDNDLVIAGQGTIALELLEKVPDLDAIVVSTGGGGMLAGVSLTVKALAPNCQVYAVEPEGKELQKCLEAGRRLWSHPSTFLNTVADSIRLRVIGARSFGIICEHVNPQVLTVNDQQMIEGMKITFERLKQVVEAAAGASVYAAVNLINKVQPDAKKVGVILCGGNVDLNALPWLSPSYSY